MKSSIIQLYFCNIMIYLIFQFGVIDNSAMYEKFDNSTLFFQHYDLFNFLIWSYR